MSEEEIPGGKVLRPFFRPRRWKMGGVLRSSCREGGRWGRVLRSSEEEVPPPPPFVSDLRPVLRARKSKMGSVLRFSAPKIENERWRFSAPKNEKKKGFFEEPPLLRRNLPFSYKNPPPSSKNLPPAPPPSFFALRVRRSKKPPPIFDLQSRRLGRRSPWAPWWVGRVGRARVAQVERDALPLEAHPPAGRSFCGARVASACDCLEPRGAVKVHLRSRVKCVCVQSARLSLEIMPCSASRIRRVFKKKTTIPRGSRFRPEAHKHVESTKKVENTAVSS